MAEVKPLVLEDGRTRVMRSTDVVYGQTAADAEVLRQSKLYTDRRVDESGGGSGVERQPLPLFSVFSCYNGSPDCGIFDSDFNLVTKGTQTANPYGASKAGELWSSQAGYFYTQGNISTSAITTYWVKSTVLNSADGNYLLRVAPNGTMSARNRETAAAVYNNFGVVLGPEGYRQNISLSFTGTNLTQYNRGGNIVLDTLTTSLNSVSVCDWVGNNTMRSAVGYNMQTGTLVLIAAKDAACNYRMHVWKNFMTKLTGKPGELNKFLLDAKAGLNGGSYKSYDFTWNANNAPTYTESQYKMRVMPCNNGQIALSRFVPSNGVFMAVATLGDNVITLDTTFNRVVCTTSYGNEKGVYYGMRHQVTWSNKWVACYAPYYYYGSGISGLAINIDDPSKCYRISYAGSSCGVTLLPIKTDGFVYSFNHANNDGNVGMSIGHFDLSVDGYQPLGINGNGAQLAMPTYGGMIDTGYTGTNYSCLANVENWNKY